MSGSDDISAMISKIVQNPEFASLVNGLRGDQGEKSSDELAHEMEEKIPDAMKMLSQLTGGEKSEETQSGESKPESTIESKLKNFDKAKAERLMLALKPYLSPERCAVIDKCMSVMNISDVIGALKGLEGLMK